MLDKIENLIKKYNIEEYFIKKYLDCFLLTLALIVAIYVDWGIKETAAGLLALFILLNPIKSEFFAKGALYFLVLTPVALVLGREGKAEKLAIIVYGMLVATVVMAIWEMGKEKLCKD